MTKTHVSLQLSRWKPVLGLLISLAFVAWCAHLVWTSEEFWQTLKQVQLMPLLICCLFQYVFVVVNGFFLRRVMKIFGLNLGFRESVNISSVTTTANTFLPANAGMALRAIYLKDKYGFEYTRFVALSAGTYLINYVVVFGCGLVATLALWFDTANKQLLLPIFLFSAGLLVLVGVLVFPFRRFNSEVRIAKLVNKVLDGWHIIRKDRRLIIDLTLISFVNVLIVTGLIYFALISVVTDVRFGSVFFLTALESLTLFIKITPGNFGIVEGVLIYGGKLIGIGIAAILIGSGIIRVSLFVVLIFVTPLSLFGLYGKKWYSALRRSS